MLELGHINNILNNRAHVNNLVVESFEVHTDLLLVLFANRHLDDLVVALHAIQGRAQVVGHVCHEHDVVVLLFRQLLDLPLGSDVAHHEDREVAKILLHPLIVVLVLDQQLVTLHANNLLALYNFVVSFKIKLEVKQLMSKRPLAIAHLLHHSREVKHVLGRLILLLRLVLLLLCVILILDLALLEHCVRVFLSEFNFGPLALEDILDESVDELHTLFFAVVD